MNTKPIAAIAAALMLAGCGTTAENADVPRGVYLGVGDRPAITAVDDVEITAAGPAIDEGGEAVAGTSCKNKLWDPAPSAENATALMLSQARERGFNAVHSIEVKPDPAALARNCWDAIIATGVAFRVEDDGQK